MPSEVAEVDAPSGALEQCLVSIVSSQEQRRSQFGLVEHHYVRFLLCDQPVQVLLLLGCIKASDVPHDHIQGYSGYVEVALGWLLPPLISPLYLWSTLGTQLCILVPLVTSAILLSLVPGGYALGQPSSGGGVVNN